MTPTGSDPMYTLEKAMQNMSLGGVSTEQSITDMANADSDSMHILVKAMQHLTIGDISTEQSATDMAYICRIGLDGAHRFHLDEAQ